MGLYYKIEEDIERLPDAFTRATFNGENESMEIFKARKYNMVMKDIFANRVT